MADPCKREQRLRDLLLLWDEARESGEEIEIETLCEGCPELVEELRQQIDALRDWEHLEVPATGRPVSNGDAQAQVPPRAPESPAVSLHLDKFEYHARGGLGVVFKAHQRDLPRDVAVKFLDERVEVPRGESRQRFLREARVTARLEHPGIVPVYGLGHDAAGRPCYAMRFIKGKTLKAEILAYHSARSEHQGRRRLALARDPDFRALLQRFKAACTTVAFAHDQGFLHRDLKPENIMLGPFDETLVVDWGLAKPIGSARDPTMRVKPVPESGQALSSVTEQFSLCTEGSIGTLGFASPEQQAGEWDRVGPASDVFSLGATLFLLLTGRFAFNGKSSAEVAASVERGVPDAPSRVDCRVPRELEAVCLKALAGKPEDRYAAALELASDLEAWLADRPVSAMREPRTTCAWRWVNQHRTLVVTSTAVLIAGLTVGSILWRNASVQTLHLRNLAYVHAEKAAQDLIFKGRPGWTWQALAKIHEAARIATPVRDPKVLRDLAVQCLAGVDLRERAKITSIDSACLAFSPDGKRLAIGEHHDETKFRVQLFDVESQSELTTYVISSTSSDLKRTGVSALAFSPDGRWLAAGLRNGQIMIWETSKQSDSPITLSRHTACVMGLAFSPDGAMLVSGSKDGLVQVWDTRRRWRDSVSLRVNDILSTIAISPDGKSIVCGFDHQGLVYSLAELMANPKSPRPTIKSESRHQQSRFSPDSQTLAVAGDWNCVRIGVGQGKEGVLTDPEFGSSHSADIRGLEFSSDGTLIVSGSQDNSVKIWGMAAHRLLLKLPTVTESMVVPTISPDGRTLAIGTSEGTTLYDVLGGDTLVSRGYQRDPLLAFSFTEPTVPGETKFATMTHELDGKPPRSADRITLWDAGSVSALGIMNSEAAGQDRPPAVCLDAHPTRPVLAYSSNYRLWLADTASGASPRSCPEKQVSSLSFGRGGDRLWGVIDELAVVSWSLTDLKRLTTWEQEESNSSSGRVGIPSLSAGRTCVVAGSRAGLIHVLRAADGQLQRTVEASGPVDSIALSPDESLVACGTVKGGVSLIRHETGQNVAEIPAHQETVTSVAFSPDGRMLATASADRTIALWKLDGPAPTELVRFASPSGRAILSVRFHPNGRILGMLVRGEHAVRLWDLNKLRNRLAELGLDWE